MSVCTMIVSVSCFSCFMVCFKYVFVSLACFVVGGIKCISTWPCIVLPPLWIFACAKMRKGKAVNFSTF